MTDARNILIQTIAETLGETKAEPIAQIRRMVERLGARRTIEIAQDAIAIEKAGGVWTLRGDRKRTVGGIFFLISRGALSPDDRRYVFPQRYMTKARSGAPEAFVQSIGIGP